eukprot:CAMPEP_0172562146 /NCGR_PEP_ID=MMETSP1067-20121228/95785_1 /TAXON_ID=265564 ORGANISM="Thalassiosira punctigera, Strain Tpunct2005C2" /NCGR_SAMPLE_ID=MMETSP1067 /ASSEMBLY_ACC=CAM_ASM_000444 /LENGTH=98 /DNA_ID=CAMNT_0013352325 /DNA_START=372 /DNA_END=668 /DNA_ORIENTATION=+
MAISTPPPAHYYPNEHFPQESSNSNLMDEFETEIELRLQAALQAAQDVDRRYGLCTPASANAWQIVDDLYSSSLRSRQVDDTVKAVLGSKKSIWSSFE